MNLAKSTQRVEAYKPAGRYEVNPEDIQFHEVGGV